MKVDIDSFIKFSIVSIINSQKLSHLKQHVIKRKKERKKENMSIEVEHVYKKSKINC